MDDTVGFLLMIVLLFMLAFFAGWLIHVKQGDYDTNAKKWKALPKELSKGIAWGLLVFPGVLILALFMTLLLILVIMDKILSLVGIQTKMANYLSSKTINRED